MRVVELVSLAVAEPEALAADVVPADGEERSRRDGHERRPGGSEDVVAVVPGHVGARRPEAVDERRRVRGWGRRTGLPPRMGLAFEGEPKPPNGGGGRAGSASSGGACGRAFGGAGLLLGRGFRLRRLAGAVVVGVGVVSVGTVGGGSAGGGGGSGVTDSHTYRWWS